MCTGPPGPETKGRRLGRQPRRTQGADGVRPVNPRSERHLVRARSKIVSSLEGIYAEAFGKAEKAGDQERMDALDFGFQRDQVMLEAMLDIRDGLAGGREDGPGGESSLLDKARAVRKFARLVPR